MRPGKASRARRLELGLPPAKGGSGRPLDDVDVKIMDALRANGRESFRRIASNLGISEATVRARFARLGEMELFQVRGVVNALALGFDAVALIGIKTASPPLGVAQQLTVWPEITSVVVTAGQFDILAEAVCESRHELLDVASRVRLIDGVTDTRMSPYLQICKHPQEWEPELPVTQPRSRRRTRGTS